jgi:hypothetical protein
MSGRKKCDPDRMKAKGRKKWGVEGVLFSECLKQFDTLSSRAILLPIELKPNFVGNLFFP